MDACAPLGSTTAQDSEDPPAADAADFPWHIALALMATYLLASLDWHWAYILPIFWLLVHSDERRRRQLWTKLHGAASAGIAASKHDESVTWLNEFLRAVWQMYEPPLRDYAIAKLQTKLDANTPRSLGVTALRIKSFSLGAVEARRSDGRHRLAPAILERVRMISKSIDTSSRDNPRQHRIRYVFRADVRWHTGSTPLLTLDINFGPRLLFMSVDAEVKHLTLAGTLQVELDFVRAYPWLGMRPFQPASPARHVPFIIFTLLFPIPHRQRRPFFC